MSIRVARPDEAAAVSALAMRAKASWGYDEAFLEACRHELTWSPEEVERSGPLVWAEGDVLVGATAALDAPPDGRLWAVFVEPARHGEGVGRALLEALLIRAREAGYRSLTIGADPNAEGFYRSVGAERIGEVESDTRAGRMLPLLRFELG